MKQFVLTLLITALCGSAAVSAQTSEKIFTLNEAIDFALQKSFGMQNISLNLESTRQNQIARKGAFKTSANLSLLAPDIAETFSPDDDPKGFTIYNSRGRTLYMGALEIKQPLPTNGSFTLSTRLSQNLSSIRDAADKVQVKRFNTSTTLNFQQPLFTPNTLKLGLERANLSFESSNLQLQRTRLDIIYQVTQSFYSYYRATTQLQISRDEMEQKKVAHDLARNKYSAGLIPEVDALETEVDLALSRNSLFTAETGLQREADLFKQTIGMDLNENVVVAADVEYTPLKIDLEKAIELALANRPEMREGEISKRLREMDVTETDARSEFRASISAFYDLSGVSDANEKISASPYTLFRSSMDDLRQRPGNKGIKLNFQMPLWDSGVNKAETAAAIARYEQASLRLHNDRATIIRDTKDVVARVRQAQDRLDVLKKSQKVAERSYEISLARFNNGDITAQILSSNRDRLTQARSAFLNAYISFQTAAADLKRKTLYDFEKNESLIQSR